MIYVKYKDENLEEAWVVVVCQSILTGFRESFTYRKFYKEVRKEK